MSPNTGPLGRPRGIAFVIIISIITFGIYHLYWTYVTFEEMKQRTKEGLGGVLGLVIGILLSIVNAFVIPSEVGHMYRGDGEEAPMTGWTGLWVLLPLVRMVRLGREGPGRAEPLLEEPRGVVRAGGGVARSVTLLFDGDGRAQAGSASAGGRAAARGARTTGTAGALLAWGETPGTFEFAIAIGAGVAAGSIALIGFGADSLIEGLAGFVIVWLFTGARLHSETAERRAQQVIAASYFLLAAYVAVARA